MKRNSSRDLTHGNIYSQLILFILPIFAGQLFQTFYNSIDALVVGKNVGTTALAAVTSSNDISQLMIGFFSGVSNGAGVVFSRYFGMKDYEKLKKAISTTTLFGLCLGMIMTICSIMFAPAFLNLISCPADVFDQALSYLRIYLIGIEFTCLYNIFASVLRAVGDSRNPFNYLLISSFANIVLDYLFVKVFSLGVNGVAFATVISQGLSVLLIISKMLRTNDVYQLEYKKLYFDFGLLREVVLLGIPSGVQASLTNLSNMSVQRWINHFGSSAMAGVGAAKKIDKFLNATTSSISYGTATYVAQNYSANKTERVKKGIRACFVICMVPVIVLGSFILLNSEGLVKMFIDDSAAIATGVEMIKIMVPLYFLQGTYHVMTYVIRGFGKSIPSMIISLSGLILCRQLYLQTAMRLGGSINHVFFSYPVGWGFTAIFAIIYYFRVIKKNYLNEES